MKTHYMQQQIIDVWHVDLIAAQHFEKLFLSFFTTEEVLRWKRLRNPFQARRFLLSRGVLRHVLSGYLKVAPKALSFRKGKYGKLFLRNSQIQFSLTHSGNCVLIAINQENNLGIDVESVSREHNFGALVDRFFSKEECVAYHLMELEQKSHLNFYRLWTRKEAYLKATGEGLSCSLSNFSVSLDANEKHALMHVGGDTSVHKKWTLFSFEIGKEYLASLAIKAPVKSFYIYHWILD